MRERPAPSHNPFRNSRFSRSSEFLYSSRWTTALDTSATASANAAFVVLWMFGAMLFGMKNEVSECPSSDLPVPFGPNRFNIGNEVVTLVTMSRNSVANRKQIAILALSPKTVINFSAYSRKVISFVVAYMKRRCCWYPCVSSRVSREQPGR